jgi:hypothetical protein
MKIYDCFTFYNELDLLELRLQEYWDKVDHFVIAEANTTHIGTPKNFIFLDNQNRFKPYLDKIIYLPITDMPGVTEQFRMNPDTGKHELWKNCWHNERHQRNSLTKGLDSANSDDVIILTDVDEIIRPECIDQIRKDTTHTLWTFRMVYFNYKFNYMWIKYQKNADQIMYQGGGHQAIRVSRIKDFPTLSYIRETYGCCWANRPRIYDDGNEMIFQHGGWHFSSLGNNEFVANKLRNVADYFLEEANSIDVNKLIDANTSQVKENSEFKPVILDSYFPKTILNNQEKYKDLIIPNAETTIMDIL